MRRKTFLIASAMGALVAWACGGSDGSQFVDLSKIDSGTDSGNHPVVPIGTGDGAVPVDQTDSSAPAQGHCSPGADGGSGCEYDTYCDPASNQCVPYATGQNNSECHQVAIPGNFAPKIKCEFPLTIPIAGDDFPNHVDVQTTPLVVRFGKDAVPSIVVPFTTPVANDYTEHLGVLRILKGTDCTQQAVLGGTDLDLDGEKDWFRSSASPAIGDLDGDGVPEIVAFMTSATTVSETLMAFTLKAGVWQPLWPKKKATLADGTTIFEANGAGLTPKIVSTSGSDFGKGNWASPSIHDLDDDGIPEIIREGWVFDGKTGVLRADPPPNYATYRQGIHPVLANLDDDAKIEMTNGARIWEFDPSTGWKEETYYDQTTTSKPGWAAIADFDPAPPATQTPEIAVASTSNLTIFTTAHAVFKGMNLAVPGGGGGPPTIADFDGDGLPEVGIAGQAFYTVFDPDCQATPRTGGKCSDRTHCDHVAGGACPDLILWSRATQDNSSNVTGSSVFDFEADGKAEVVYADECFTRVYNGSDGTVLFSRYRSSCTWNENPVVADVDGDFRAELVVGSNTACGAIGVGQPCLATNDDAGANHQHGQLEPGTDIDSQFIGLRCLKGTDCISGNCDNGFCRCTTSADCCADKDTAKCETFGTKCAVPPAGTPGTGNTCRANHPKAIQGVRVYEDANDQWVRSRSIWNQHAYAVTNVNEDGTIPKTSAWAKNWTQPGLNNFRQNVPGTASAFDIGDLTSQAAAAFQCSGSTAVLATPVCNRGTAPIGAGVSVGFYAGTNKACGATTKNVLQPGACESVSCEWTSPPTNTPGVDVDVIPNDDGAIAQCDPNNDKGLVKAVFCTGVK